MEIFKELSNFLFGENKDPVKECEVYLNEGCSHVDGYFCNMTTCNIRNVFLMERKEQ